ncbi:MAG: D-alanine--D-alanine ligase family protein [Aminipila sp.]
MIKIGVIFGGKSGEHEISLMSAASVINALDKTKFEPFFFGITKEGKWKHFEGTTSEIENGQWERKAKDFNPGRLKEFIDFALPILHGPYGEDGTIQGMFEMLDIPYAGCGVLASAAAMDKAIAKDIFAKAGLPICKHALSYAEDFMIAGKIDEKLMEAETEKIEAKVPYPMFVKPANMGSSVGITKAKDREGLYKALLEAAKYDRRIVVEEGIDCRELETGVIGNHNPKAAAVGEILPSAEFYDYKAKYFDGGQSKICVPANISDDIKEQIRDIAVRAYMALDCAGFSRVDFFLERKINKIYINEINTIPGFTKFSMFPVLWEEAGIPYSQLIERIVDFGYERYHAKNSR